MALTGEVSPENSAGLKQQGKEGGDNEPQSKLGAEDMARVEKYLASPIHSVERKPFRPYMMMLALMAVVGGLSLLSILISVLVLE